MTTLTEILNNPEEHYPGNFDTPKRANALLTGLCQDASAEINRLVSFNQQLMDEVARLNKAVADEREQIAQMLEPAPPLVTFVQNGMGGCLICGFTPKLAAEAIRARGNT